jgi:hypothetical protein
MFFGSLSKGLALVHLKLSLGKHKVLSFSASLKFILIEYSHKSYDSCIHA